jgi:hypothetical protein
VIRPWPCARITRAAQRQVRNAPLQVHRHAILPGAVIQRFDEPRRSAGAGIGADHIDHGPRHLRRATGTVHPRLRSRRRRRRGPRDGPPRSPRPHPRPHRRSRPRPRRTRNLSAMARPIPEAPAVMTMRWLTRPARVWSGPSFSRTSCRADHPRAHALDHAHGAFHNCALVASTPFSSQRLSSSPTRTCPPASTAAAA